MSLSLLLLTLLTLTACGMILHGTSQNILCTTTPSGALVRSSDGTMCMTPCSVTLKRNKDDTLTIERDGYESVTLSVRSVLSKSCAGEILLPGGIVCWSIDLASGGGYQLLPERIDIKLNPAATQPH